ncbi:MAG: hypothetical protein MZV64_33845 [Ignavibacteriales bacterium]|nr:hypothetical protein [Ignavibacteriales bacterium]
MRLDAAAHPLRALAGLRLRRPGPRGHRRRAVRWSRPSWTPRARPSFRSSSTSKRAAPGHDGRRRSPAASSRTSGDFPASTRSPCPFYPYDALRRHPRCPRATRPAACCSPTRTTRAADRHRRRRRQAGLARQAGGQPLQGRVEVVVGQERRLAGPVRRRHAATRRAARTRSSTRERRRAAGSSRSSTRSGAATWCASVDPQSGHAAGQIVYIDWPGWAGRAREERRRRRDACSTSAPTRSATRSAKRRVIFLPDAAQGRALVSLENGTSASSKQMWVEHARRARTASRSTLDDGMTPNVYVHVTLHPAASGQEERHAHPPLRRHPRPGREPADAAGAAGQGGRRAEAPGGVQGRRCGRRPAGP